MNDRDDRNSAPRPLASSAARRVEAIIEGAERAAEQVIDDAEAKARAYLAEAEAEADRTVEERLASLGELTDALVAQADSIRRQSELLIRSLREAKERLEVEAGSPSEAGQEQDGDGISSTDESPQAPRLAAVEPAAPERPAPQRIERWPERRESGTPAGARLLATQMAVSGSSREEIAERLRRGFEIEDADAILDAILGPEADA